MNRCFILALVVCCLLAGREAFAQTAASAAPQPQYVEGHLYVKFKEDLGVTLEALQSHSTGIAEVDRLLDGYSVYLVHEFDPNAKNIEVCRRHGIDRMYVLYFPRENHTLNVAYAFLGLESIESVSPRYLAKPCFTPNDQHWGSLWGLRNGVMNFEMAWNLAQGDSNTVIAIVDMGVNYTHEDLEANIHYNPGETGVDDEDRDKRTNGIDDDADGYVDNWRGIDLMGNDSSEIPKPDNDPMPDAASATHGTMVAGCAGAVPNNGKGVIGTGFNCSIMPVKVANAKILYLGWEGIEYAYTHGAKAIVCSWVDDSILPEFLGPFQDLVDAAAEAGCLVVAAAGNHGTDDDVKKYYPASFATTLTVGSTQQDDKPAASGTNFGKIVDVFAPGHTILTTTLPDIDSYGISNGTSFAAPYVGGLVGLLASMYPEWTPKLISRQIVETCDNVVNPANREKYWGRVNAYRAVSEPTFPGLIITDVSVDSVQRGLLNYINKQYTLDIKFKNVVSPGNVTVTLLDAQNYIPVQATAPLGMMETGDERNGRFVFTRDPLEYVKPGKDIKLVFYASDGNKYKDTLYVYVRVAKDLQWSQGSVSTDAQPLDVTNWPNPASSVTTVRLTLPNAEEFGIAVIDMLGRHVLTVPLMHYAAGMQEIELHLGDLPVGMYSYVVQSRTGIVSTKPLVIAR